ncbi:hypothetical protein D4764_03G0005820 [Takifugu flavidus]|uniref:Uncharacterized protein n=1 Tax=Takifugu flavidus TaxID=433684 RepID=A0A5C6N7V2_9TELE|nr:hypothetical protein D4764_03G0005820 [Takifugu flavidus]
MLLSSRKTNFLNLRYILLLTLRLLSNAVEGKSRVIGSSDPVLAVEGEDVVLPCFVEPKENVVELTLEWAKVDSNPQDLTEAYAHVYRDGPGASGHDGAVIPRQNHAVSRRPATRGHFSPNQQCDSGR